MRDVRVSPVSSHTAGVVLAYPGARLSSCTSRCCPPVPNTCFPALADAAYHLRLPITHACLPIAHLLPLHLQVVLAYGAETDRKLGIPGEGAGNVLSAREFVWWYNGHPDAAQLPVNLAGVESVAVRRRG